MRVLSLESHYPVGSAADLLDLLEFQLVPRICRYVGLALRSTIIGNLKLRVLTETVVVFVKRRYKVLICYCTAVPSEHDHVLTEVSC